MPKAFQLGPRMVRFHRSLPNSDIDCESEAIEASMCRGLLPQHLGCHLLQFLANYFAEGAEVSQRSLNSTETHLRDLPNNQKGSRLICTGLCV